MSNGSPVPATAFSSFALDSTPSVLWVAGQRYTPSGGENDPYIWLVVLDLTSLKLVASEISDGSTVPPDIGALVGNAQYFLYAISSSAWASSMPQGDLYGMLQKVGSGPKLARLEQIYATIGTGYLGNFSYILAASMAEGDEPGFETLSMGGYTILTMGFVPITVGGQTIYAPVQVGSD